MGLSANDIATASFADLGIYSPDPASLTDALRRLNNMVSGWRTQYQTVLAVTRTIFPLVENQQTYTIGLGGDFNVPRPNKITGAGLWLNGLDSPQAVTSITRSGYTATVTQIAHGYAVGDEAFIDGCDPIAYNGLQTVQSVPTADTYTFTVNGTPTTPATGTITAASVQGQPVEIPRAVIADSDYQNIGLKNMPNGQFTAVYYNPTSTPFGTIFLWPKPNTSANQLVLYLEDEFGGFADLTTTYDWPDNPGYAEALQYQLDLRLCVPYGRALLPELRDLAAKTFGCIKRANNKLNDVNSDASLLTWNGRAGYNINTDTGS